MPNGAMRLPQRRGFLQTMRRDAWWVEAVLTLVVLLGFLVWANYRVFEGAHYFSGHSAGATNAVTNYLTPFYSPLFFEQPGMAPSGHAWFGSKSDAPWKHLPAFVSPAALILIFPAGFRLTCYYYRGAYYKAFWGDPPSCAVGEPRNSYLGEAHLPLILQNIHRYFLYFALAFLVLLTMDAWHGLWFRKAPGSDEWQFGVGVGSLILIMNVYLLGGYTLGCHSLRHLIGGGRDRLSGSPMTQKMYGCVTCLNKRHMVWAWCSLFWVAFTDLYVRQVAAGSWTDWRLF